MKECLPLSDFLDPKDVPIRQITLERIYREL